MKLLIALLLTTTAIAQDPVFKTQWTRWSNHDVPELIKPFMVPPNGQAKQDGIIVTVLWESGRVPEAAEVTVIYRTTDGKRMKQVRTTTLVNTGCTPEPCAWMPILFDIGVVDLSSITISAVEWSTEWTELVTNKENSKK